MGARTAEYDDNQSAIAGSRALTDRLAMAATLSSIAAIYGLCMSPFVGAGDSGEFIVTAARLAAPHPPGYPLYTYLAHLFTWLPVSTVAWRVGLFSLVCQVAANGVVFQLMREWSIRTSVAVVTTLLYSLTPLIWRYAMEAEVFALNNLFAAILLLFFWRVLRAQSSSGPPSRQRPIDPARAMPWLGLLLGLGATNHLTILMFAFPFVIFYLIRFRAATLRSKPLLLTVSAFLAGLTPYLLMFLLGRNRALYSWGDFSSWSGWWTHVSRAEYGSFQLATGDKANADFWTKIYFFLQEMVLNLHGLGLVLLAAAGAAVFLGGKVARLNDSARRSFAQLLLFAVVFYATIFHALSNLDLRIPLYYHTQARMWLLPLLLLCLLAGYGFNAIVVLAAARAKRAQDAVAAIALAAIVLMTALHWRVQDKSHDDFFERVGRTMIDAVAMNSVILMREDAYVNALRYLQEIEGLRPDVKVIPLDALWWPWMSELVAKNVPDFILPGQVIRPQKFGLETFTLAELIDANIASHPIYVSKITPDEELTLREKYWGFPYGFHSRIKLRNQDFNIDELKLETAPFLSLKMPAPETYKYESWETFIRFNYFFVKLKTAQLFIQRAGGRPEWIGQAKSILKAIVVENPAGSQEAKAILDVLRE